MCISVLLLYPPKIKRLFPFNATAEWLRRPIGLGCSIFGFSHRNDDKSCFVQGHSPDNNVNFKKLPSTPVYHCKTRSEHTRCCCQIYLQKWTFCCQWLSQYESLGKMEARLGMATKSTRSDSGLVCKQRVKRWKIAQNTRQKCTWHR